VGGINDWLASACGEGKIAPISPSEKVKGAGEGRIISLTSATTLAEVVRRVKVHLSLSNVRIAPRMDAVWETRTGDAEATMAMAAGIPVSTAAVCAGSGGSVFAAPAAGKCDVWLTGELSHHEVLAATQAGISVILTDHSNTERGYLPTLASRIEEGMAGAAKCVVTELDADPLTVV
jgi:putative NIF3 family GTP cyclohydrolase 1 type 2